ncbi:MAG: hypothetical protein KAI64_00345, partial [Thermoplasmata archaeon]|nr:hypothetical protein [Thermoplasmata archaeon]
GTIGIGGEPASYATIRLQSYGGLVEELLTSDDDGMYELIMPEGSYSLTSAYFHQGIHYSFIGKAVVERNESLIFDIALEESSELSGVAYLGSKVFTKNEIEITFESTDGNGRYHAVTNNVGHYTVRLPDGDYDVKVSWEYYFLDTASLDGDTVYDVPLLLGETIVGGFVYYDINQNSILDANESLGNVNVGFIDSGSKRIDVYTNPFGFYGIALDKNESYIISVDVQGYEPFSTSLLNVSQIEAAKNITVIPSNVTLSGNILYNNISLAYQPVEIAFDPISEGAIAASTLSNAGGTYNILLRPGDYAMVVDHEVTSGEKYMNIETGDEMNVSLFIGDESRVRDITVVKKFELNGTIELEGVNPSELMGVQLSIVGPEYLDFTSDSTFSIYLIETFGEDSYTIYADFTYQGTRYTNISAVSMLEPMDVNIELEAKVDVDGLVLYDDDSVGEELLITFTRDMGGTIATVANPGGDFDINLTPGNYSVEVNHSTMEVDETVRFIKYFASSSITVPPLDEFFFTIELDKALDNTSIQGTVVDAGGSTISAELNFYSIDDTAINTTLVSASNGKYSGSIHPGLYTIYAVHEGDVNMSTLEVFVGQPIE